MLPAALVLAIMVLPTVAAVSQDALRRCPKVSEAAYGLGATRWEAILKVMLPAASSGIFGALVLGFGRALGETMALAMLVGNSNQISLSLFSPANTLAALLALNFPEAGPREVAVLMYAALVLLAITLVVNVIGEVIMALTSERAEARDEHRDCPVAAGARRRASSARPSRAAARSRACPDRRRVWRRRSSPRVPLFSVLYMLIVRGGSRLQLEPVRRAAARRLRDGRRLRQRDRRHARDGRPRRRCSAFPSACWPPSTWPSSGRTADSRQAARFAAKTLTGHAVDPRRRVRLRRRRADTGSYSAPAGGVALAVLMLPTVILTAEEAIKAVPQDQREAAFGMGCTRSQVVWKVRAADRHARHPDRRDAGRGPGRRRDGAAAVHRAVQQLLALRGRHAAT